MKIIANLQKSFNINMGTTLFFNLDIVKTEIAKSFDEIRKKV